MTENPKVNFMSIEKIWEIEMKVKIDVITKTPTIKLTQDHDPDLLKVEILPEKLISESNQDIFLLKIQFIYHDEKNATVYSISNYGKQLLNGMVSRIAFTLNRPIIKITPPILTYHYPDSNKYRKLLFSDNVTTISPPVQVDNFDFLGMKIDPKITIILNLLHESMITSDLIGSYIYLWSALEILLSLFDFQDFEPKKCINCGFIYQKNPGIADRYRNVLINQFSIEADLVEKIWHTRNEISHHGLELSDSELFAVETLRNKLYQVVKRLIKFVIYKEDTDAIEPNPFSPFITTCMDIEYTI